MLILLLNKGTLGEQSDGLDNYLGNTYFLNPNNNSKLEHVNGNI